MFKLIVNLILAQTLLKIRHWQLCMHFKIFSSNFADALYNQKIMSTWNAAHLSCTSIFSVFIINFSVNYTIFHALWAIQTN